MIDIHTTEDSWSKKKQRLSDLEGLIQGEKCTVDDLRYKIEHHKCNGTHNLPKLLKKHEELLGLYLDERQALRDEMNAGRDLYAEIMAKYNAMKSLQKVVDEWFEGAKKAIEREIADVKAIEPDPDDEVVEIELRVYTEPVEVDIFPFHRRKDESQPVTTRQHSHKARVHKKGRKRIGKRDSYRHQRLVEIGEAEEIQKRESEWAIQREREKERLRQAKVRRDNKKKNNNESHITSNTETSGTCEQAGGHHHRLGDRHQHRNGKEIG